MLVCLYKSEKPSLSLGNQAILHIRKGTVKRSFRWCPGLSGAGCLGKQQRKGARGPSLAEEVVFHSLGGKRLCGQRCGVSMPLDISKVKLTTDSYLPAIKGVTLKNLLHTVHTIPRNSPAVETLARSGDHRRQGHSRHLRAGRVSWLKSWNICALKGPSRGWAES